MTGLIHQVEAANIAGKNLSQVELALKAGGTKKIYTQKQMRDFLLSLAQRENIAESAHNAVVGEIRKHHATFMDESNTAKERCLAIMEARYLVDQYAVNLKKAIEAYDADALPTDLGELKALYKERLEAVATQKVADIKNAATQHGVDLPESCIDQVNATRRVANKMQKGQIELQRATTAKEFKDLFDTWKFRIEGVKVKNVPKWKYVSGTRSYFENDGTEALALSGRGFEFTAFSPPADPAIPGLVAAESFEAWDENGQVFTEISAALDGNKIRFIVDQSVPGGKLLRLRLGARNLCGPSHFHINLTTTALPV